MEEFLLRYQHDVLLYNLFLFITYLDRSNAFAFEIAYTNFFSISSSVSYGGSFKRFIHVAALGESRHYPSWSRRYFQMPRDGHKMAGLTRQNPREVCLRSK